MLKKAFAKRPANITDDSPVLERVIHIIKSEDPDSFWRPEDLEKRRFFNAPRPGTPHADAVYPFPKGLL
jgi:hypothetical protein